MLAALGIPARGVTSDESLNAFAGRFYYSDMPASLDRFGERQFAATRVDINAVQRVANAYLSGVGAPEQATAAAQALSGAATRYMTLSQASDVDPAAFRSYLESTPDEQATLAQIQQLERLLADLKGLGLPPVEYRQARAALLSKLASDSLTPELIARTVEKGS
jgi:hypothetical protein